jgi:hypothetical protein
MLILILNLFFVGRAHHSRLPLGLERLPPVALLPGAGPLILPAAAYGTGKYANERQQVRG